MWESIAAVALAFKEVITTFTIGRFLIWFLILSLVGSGLFAFYEYQTDHFYYQRLNKRLDYFKRLTDESSDPSLVPKVQQEYHEVLEHLKSRSIDKPSIPLLSDIPAPIVIGFWKFITALVVPFIGLAITLSQEEDRSEWREIIVGVFAIAGISGFVAVLIPTIHAPWVNYLGMVVLQTLLVVIGAYVTPDEDEE